MRGRGEGGKEKKREKDERGLSKDARGARKRKRNRNAQPRRREGLLLHPVGQTHVIILP